MSRASFRPQAFVIAVVLFALAGSAGAQNSVVNWESPHVHPLDMTPDGVKLLGVNTPDNRIEVFDIGSRTGNPVSIGAIPVGIDPVSVRARTNTEAWVANHLSDSVSVVDLTTFNVVATLPTDDEPTDVVFAGTPQRAFVSCSQANTVLVFDPANLATPPVRITIEGEDPRAMAVSADKTKVYVAVFESGNQTTSLGAPGGVESQRNPVNKPDGPYGGVNPPPNFGDTFKPPMNNFPTVAPRTSLILKKDPVTKKWMDDNAHDWSDFVGGPRSAEAERSIGWDVSDNDLATIDAATLGVTYSTGLMNLCMSLAVKPPLGRVTVVGTDATNVIRFEPNLKSRFLRVNLAFVDPTNAVAPTIVDLNTHLDYSDDQVARQADTATASQSLRDLSVGDPRAIVWDAKGTTGYVAGMGSNDVTVINGSGGRNGSAIAVGEGPTGLVLNVKKKRLYVMNKFAASVSAINTQTRAEVARVAFFDPSPVAIKNGRKFLYDTHRTSGLGHASCGSCHADARMDRLAWDLGDPSGQMKTVNVNCVIDATALGCRDWHPMKGPMVTQTLQDIIGKEPHHWRGDREGLEAFNPAFQSLMGDDVRLTTTEMQQFEDFLATITIPPNPFRNFDNTLKDDMDLTAYYSAGTFAAVGGLARGTPLLNGSAIRGLSIFRVKTAHSAGGVDNRSCVSCHTLPTGLGTDSEFVGDFPNSGVFVPAPVGPNGEHHTSSVGFNFGSPPQKTFKVQQLRTLYDKDGFIRTRNNSRAGFGFFNGGATGLVEFMSDFPKFMNNDQQVSDIIAFLLSFSGSDLPEGSPDTPLEAPGVASQDTHAAVGAQVTVTATNETDQAVIDRIASMAALADAGRVGLVAKGRRDGAARGWVYLGGGTFQSDVAGETIGTDDLRLGSAAGAETTFTLVPLGSERRIGVDRDSDGIYDGDE